ncbi:DUF1542 domain-containing protein [Fructobacillus sp. M2-14]|uniref:DUF1542 domain-containing protein n=1 Tax=Fructobacillus broussonetiae TaxID=2713173 RepID=A0ABS5R081_9LACO|nr:DUF1542 domain-containing protein [Fructobacillus broussonetiae]MBS9338820.1 DUF1542 domain-containing protein [Fructobacillus broussonetiae]
MKQDEANAKAAVDQADGEVNKAQNALNTANDAADRAKTDYENADLDAKSKASVLEDKKKAASAADEKNRVAQEQANQDAAKRQAALDAAKKAAQAIIEKQKADAEAKIKAMLDLAKDSDGNVDGDVNNAAKSELAKINQDYEKAQKAISGAKDSSELSDGKNAFDTNSSVDVVKNKLSEKTNTDQQKEAAKAAIKHKTEEAQKSLDNLDGLDEKAKALVQDKVKADAKKANDVIENQVAGLDHVFDGGNHDTDSLVDIVNNTNFDKDVQDAKDKVKAFADALKKSQDKVKNESARQQGQIDNMDNISQTDKDAAKEKVRAEEKKTLDKVNASTSADDIQAKEDDGLSFKMDTDSIFDDLNKQDSLEKQKKDATDLIDQDIDVKKASIDSMNNLSDGEKSKAKDDLDKEAKRAKNQINGSHDKDDLTNNFENGSYEKNASGIIDGVGNNESLYKQKVKAMDAVDEDADARKVEIDAMDKLSADDKEKAKFEIDYYATEAKDKIDDSIDADALIKQGAESTFPSHRDAIMDKIAKQPSMDQQKASAKDAIDRDATAKKNAIDKMDNLSSKEKQKAKEDLDKAVIKDKAAVDGAKKKADIDAMKTLTKDQKEKAKAKIDAAAEENKAAIDHTVNKDKLTDQIDDPTFDNQVQKVDEQMASNGSIDDQKAKIQKQMEDALAKAKAQIDRDPTLSEDEKAAQKASLDQNWAQKKAALMNAEDADALFLEKEAAMDLFEDVHLSGLSLNQQKQVAKDKVAARVAAMKKAIENDMNLTHLKKELRLKMLDKVQSDFFEKLDQAESTDAIRDLLTNFEDALSAAQDGHLTALPEAGKRANLSNVLTEIMLGMTATLTSLAYFATKKRDQG